MKYKEVKNHYKSGQLKFHYFVDDIRHMHSEFRRYHKNGQIGCHYFRYHGYDYGEVKTFNGDGSLLQHYLKDGNGNELATVIENGKPATHTEEQLIEIAKEHGVPLLSDLPKTEAELTHWNLKHPDCPCLPIESE